MRASSAVFAGVCLIAVTAFAQPKEPNKAPLAAKKPANAEKALAVVSPIEGFALSNMSSFEVGELSTKCVIDRKRGELTTKTRVLPAKDGASYGGCCFEHTEALAVDANISATASLYMARPEDLVQVTLEQSTGMKQSYLHNGKLEAGAHQLITASLGLTEVRRLCVAVFGVPESAPHDAAVTIKRVTFGPVAAVQR